MFKNILVPTDGGPLSRKAANAAIKLASGLGARITAVFATTSFTPIIIDLTQRGRPDPERQLSEY
jgi:nucleotide-binding universal stress UspA family protein